ncbi:MAG: hypothetical protein U5N55_06835 [Cypionkella sp.]|nr:hypothetical protein [Cypionkella sp.]
MPTVCLPAPLLDRAGCGLSFSGLKTAVRRARDAIMAQKAGLTMQDNVMIYALPFRPPWPRCWPKSRAAQWWIICDP